MTKEQQVKKITETLYTTYGTDSGYLLGIEPKYRDSVEVIVKFILDYINGKRKDNDG